MQLLRNAEKGLVFSLDKREKQLLVMALRLYPLLPLAHHRISRGSDNVMAEKTQSLLSEAMGAQKDENKRRLDLLLANERHLVEAKTGWRLNLDFDQVEWFLQVLNDVRVGSWLILGCPDPEDGETPDLNPQNARYVVSMEVCGHVEAAILHALEQSRAG